MRLLVYADLQATEGDERCFGNPAISLQQYRVKKFFETIWPIYTEHKCDGLIDLGDTTDDRSAIPVPVIDTVIAGLESFPVTENNFKIIGNHEQYLRNATVDVGRMFNTYFRVVHTRAVMETPSLVYFFISYPDDHDKLAQFLDHHSLKYRKKPKLLFGHFQIVGSALNTGAAITGVPRQIMDRFELAMLGHIHLPQSLSKRLHYVGSPFQQNWGEAGQNKRVAILNTDSLEIEWVPITGFPVYRQAKFAEFKTVFDPESEDRWKVILGDHADTEAFFAFPYSNRFEAVYDYKPTENESVIAEKTARDWSFGSSLKRWTEVMPPGNHGIDISPEELIDIGSALAKGEL